MLPQINHADNFFYFFGPCWQDRDSYMLSNVLDESLLSFLPIVGTSLHPAPNSTIICVFQKKKSIHEDKCNIYVKIVTCINIFHGRDQKQSFENTCFVKKSRKRVDETVNICKIDIYKYFMVVQTTFLETTHLLPKGSIRSPDQS